MEIFKLFGSIYIDTDAADKSLQKVEKAAEKLGNGIVSMGDRMSAAGGKLTMGVTTPIVALGAKAVKTAADFESSMSEVSAISGATGEDLQKLESLAKKMGETTRFSASEAAEALKYMAMAGWKTEDMLNGLEGIMNLSAASGENLGATSDIVTDALTAFGLSAADSGHFADLLAKASSNANTNVSMMGETFKYVAPVAGALGYSAEDVALAVGLMANSGIKASQAGTSLRASMTNLAKPTKEMRSVMVALGLATEETANVIDEGKLQRAQAKVENKTIDMEKAQIKYNDAVAKYGAKSSQAQTAALNLAKAENNLEAAVSELNAAMQGKNETTEVNNTLLVDSQGKMKSFREVMNTLRDAFRGLSEEEQAQAAATLFGKEAMSGMLAIINASEEDFNKLASSIDSADGAAKEMADTMNNNLSGQITLLKSQMEAIFIQFAELIMPYLKEGLEWLSKVLTYISSLDDGTKRMIVKIGLLVAVIGPLMTILGKGISTIGTIITVGSKLVGGIGTLIKVGGVLSGGIVKVVGLIGGIAKAVAGFLIPAISSVGAPVLVVIAVIGALIAAGVALYKNWETISEFGGKCWEGIKDFFSGIGEAISNIFRGIGEVISNVFHGIGDMIGGVKDKVVAGVEGMKDGAVQRVTEMSEKISTGFQSIKDGAIQKVTEMGGNVAAGFQNMKDQVTDKIRDLKENWGGKFTEAKEKIVSEVEQMKEGASRKVAEMGEKISTGFQSIKDGAIQKVTEMGGNVAAGFQNMKDQVTDKIRDLKENWGGKFTEAKEKIVSEVEQMKEGASRKVTEMGEKISTGFQNIKDRATEKIQDLKEQWGGRFTEAKDKILTETQELGSKVAEHIGQMRDNALEKISEISENGVAGFLNLRERGAEAVSKLKDTLGGYFENMSTFVSSTFEGIGNRISSLFSGVSDTVKGIIDKVKGFMDFDWKMPKIKLPHFSINWDSSGMLGTLATKIGLPGLPKLDVEWYKGGGIMMEPTAFGINPSSGKMMAGGEAGPEAIAPIDLLKEYIADAVEERDGQLFDVISAILDLLREYLPKCGDMKMVLNTGELVGRLAQPLNEELGWIRHKRERGS